MSRRFFTVDEAEALLPWLTEVIERLQELARVAHAKRREQELCKAVGWREDGTLIMAHDYRQAEEAFTAAVKELDRLIGEIHARGCQLKDIDRGLVDFPAVVDGAQVLLCWMLGEPRIEWYHDYRSGFAGRRRLARR